MTLSEMIRIVATDLELEQRNIADMKHTSTSLAKRYVQLGDAISILLDKAKIHEVINRIDEQLPETD